jgi:tRNA threonylcarbamoyladenosine biosynthesis protein TsaE
MKYISRGLEDTQKLAEELARSLKRGESATVIALIGDLGVGKTAFSKAFGEALGVRDPIQSPTFLIEKIYELRGEEWEHLIHIDAYRLEHESELVSLGWQAIISKPENCILVEWADKVENILPEGSIRITFAHIDETAREIEIHDR